MLLTFRVCVWAEEEAKMEKNTANKIMFILLLNQDTSKENNKKNTLTHTQHKREKNEVK